MPAPTEPRAASTKSSTRAWTVCEASPVAQIAVDRTGTIRAVNGAAVSLLSTVADYLPGDPARLVGEPIDALRFVTVADDAGTSVDEIGDRTIQTSVVPWSTGHLVLLVDVSEHTATQRDVDALRRFEVDAQGQLAAISKAQAVIEFELDGTIITANNNFLGAMGYELDEVVGQHHRLFVTPGLASSGEYTGFWNALRAGEYQSGAFKRIGKGGREVWIQASYNPILGADGEPFKVVKYATDITESMTTRANFEGQLAAISKAQAVIEFELDGTIITANDNFLNAMGYALDEVRGQHHRTFVDPETAGSAEYSAFWAALRSGEYQAGEFRRLAKGSREVWIQASYNPILDPDGRPFKVVKYATDVTETVQARQRLELGIEEMLSVVDQLVSSSSQLSDVSEEMGATAEESAAQANVVAAAAEEVSANVSTVASATEEMTASIREIASNSANAASVAGRAVEVAQDTNATAAKLGESSAEIGQIVKVITSIAQQTNLLALNATIEAARAGEVGKGFAVVANEVKELAKATARATEDISQKIETIQSDTGSVVGAIDDISEIIGQISDIQSTIASAVEEQAATTSEIGRNVTEAARGSSEIAENITSVAEAAASTSGGAAQTRGSAVELTDIADSLRTLITGLSS